MMKWTLTLFLSAVLTISCSQAPKATDNPNREPNATEEDPWTTWSNDETNHVAALNALRNIRNDLLKNSLHDPHVNYGVYGRSVTCEEDVKYRSADGTCYRTDEPLVGASGVAFGRNVPPRYIDQTAEDRLNTPNPIEVSKVFFTRDHDAEAKSALGKKYGTNYKPVPFLNMIAASWIQFMNHDWLTHGRNNDHKRIEVSKKDGSRGIVDRTKVNPVSADKYDPEYKTVTLNEVTHWWDGSQIYGSNAQQQEVLRTGNFGKMRMEGDGENSLLPKRSGFDVATNVQNQGVELTGFMDNWWVGLSMLHTLFVREHNAIADHLRETYVEQETKDGKFVWTGNYEKRFLRSGYKKTNSSTMTSEELDEHIFQLARLINSAVMAKIHTVEWTPAILSNDILKLGMYSNWYGLANPTTFQVYFSGKHKDRRADMLSKLKLGFTLGGIVGQKTNNHGVPFSITEEFTSVYRLHSLLPEELYLRKFNDSKSNIEKVPFLDSRNEMSRPIMEKYNLKDMFYSFGTQLPGQLVLNNFPEFMQNLPIPQRGIMDLGMVDILRDRERGVPRYNEFREALNLKKINCYFDFFERFPSGWDYEANKCDREKYFNDYLNLPIAMSKEEKANSDTVKKIAGEVQKERLAEVMRRKEILAKFDSVYGKDASGQDNINEIDLLVGTLAEEVRPKGFGFGETMFQIFILMASRRLMADPFFTDKYSPVYYTQAGIDWIDYKGRLADVLVRHMPEVAPKIEGKFTAFEPWNE